MKRFFFVCLTAILSLTLFSPTKVTADYANCGYYDPNAPAPGQPCPSDVSLGQSFDCGATLNSTCVCSTNLQCTVTDVGTKRDAGKVTSVSPKGVSCPTGQAYAGGSCFPICGVGLYCSKLTNPTGSSRCATLGASVEATNCCPSGKILNSDKTSCISPPVANPCTQTSLTSCNASAGKWCQNVNRCYPSGASVNCVAGVSQTTLNSQIDAACGISSGTPTDPGTGTPTTPTVGMCDGCMDKGSCDMRKGSWTEQLTGTCAAQHGYCNGTTYCGAGTVATPAPLNKACGDKCTSNADCRNPSTNGSPTACINGTCQNTMCAAGMTIPGANCSCGANTRKCGQTCSGTVGLCGPGQGTCTYVNPPAHWYTGLPDCAWGSTAYCVGTQNGFSRVQCTTGDAPGGGYAKDPSGNVKTIDTSKLAASCQVCGNGDVEVGEQCDDGTKNGTPGSSCTANTCMKVTCGMTCTSDASCGAKQHTVRILRNSGVANAVFAADSILDKGIYYDGSPMLVPGGATWSVVSDATTHGGSYLSTTLPGAVLTYKTYSPSFVLNVKAGPTAAVLDIYVDGKLTTSVKDLTSKTGWVGIPITVGEPNQYACEKIGTTSVCRLTVNPGSSICEIPPATPVPSATPSPLVCNMSPTITSTGSATAWKIGDKITFSVGAATSAGLPITSKIRYEGQVAAYRGTTKVSIVDLTPINASASQFMPMTVNAVNATYFYRFRYCVTSATNIETCSAWGAWAAPEAPVTTTATPVPIAPGTLCTSLSGCICTNTGRLMQNTWTCP